MQRTHSLLFAALTISLFAGCGGGGDGAGSDASVISDANAVQVSLIGAEPLDRFEHTTDLIQLGFQLAADAGLTSSVLNCPNGGTVAYVRSGSVHLFTADACVLDVDKQNNPTVVATSGTWQSSDAAVGGSTPGGGFLARGTVTLTDVVFDIAAGQALGLTSAPAGSDSTSGSLLGAFADAATGNWSGALNVTRNGHLDRYTQIALTAAPSSGLRTSDLSAADYDITSVRLTGSLQAVWDFTARPVLTLLASDGTAAKFSLDVSLTNGIENSRFERFPFLGSGASSDRVLSNTDPEVSAGINAALQ